MTTNKLSLKWKVFIFLGGIVTALVLSYDVIAATPDNSFSDLAPDISIFRDLSITGLFGLFLFAYLRERRAQAKKDELITSKLMSTLEANSAAMTKVSDAIISFPKECAEIQRSLRFEVSQIAVKNGVNNGINRRLDNGSDV